MCARRVNDINHVKFQILRNQHIAQARRESERCGNEELSEDVVDPQAGKNRKYVETYLLDQPVKSHPFTFIAAVKRKLTLSAYKETSKRLNNSIIRKSADPLNTERDKILGHCPESLYETIQKMDFVKPLKVPEVKISPKTLDYASKETPNSRDTLKISMASQKNGKGPKSGGERAQCKLDFSLSESHSLVSCDEVEPLRAPDVSISPSLTKQKEARDSPREKENRNKEVCHLNFSILTRNYFWNFIEDSSADISNSTLFFSTCSSLKKSLFLSILMLIVDFVASLLPSACSSGQSRYEPSEENEERGRDGNKSE